MTDDRSLTEGVYYSATERADYDLLNASGRTLYDTLRQAGESHADAFFEATVRAGFKPAQVIHMEALAGLGLSGVAEYSLSRIAELGDQETIARVLAFYAHETDLDQAGLPYIGHLARVVSRLRADGHTGQVLVAGWLHDIRENLGFLPEDLVRAGVAAPVVEAVDALTKRKGEPNVANYARVASDDIAFPVKRIGDVPDNSDPRRLALLDAVTRARLTRKYQKAIAVLDELRPSA